jgi:hypothetical protein
MVETTSGWELVGFTPTSTAFNYPMGVKRKAFIYGFHYDGFVKIGRSGDPERRLKDIQRRFGNPKLEIIGILEVPYAGSIYAERLMHVRFEDKMLKREWFDIAPHDFTAYLPQALIGARLYEQACREWWDKAHPNGEY